MREKGDFPVEQVFLLGHPVAHSKSPAMHNAAYRALGIDWEYGLADVAGEDDARGFLRARDWVALNVTMPYKPLALEVADARSQAAVFAGGANVLVNSKGRLHADNVDGVGCVSFLQRSGLAFDGARVAVCGTGPTARAVLRACAEAGAQSVALLGRDSAKAKHVLQELAETESGTLDATRFAAGAYAEGADALEAASLIVDATPLGMNAGDPAPFDTAILHPGQTVLDVVYGHGETAFLCAAREVGCTTYDGEGMLVAQAVETVRVIADATGALSIPEGLDLFAIMAEACAKAS